MDLGGREDPAIDGELFSVLGDAGHLPFSGLSGQVENELAPFLQDDPTEYSTIHT